MSERDELAPHAVLSPRSVAIVGASDDPTKTASRPLRYIRQSGYDGKVYPVARRPTVFGERAWPTLSDLPDRPEHAFILLPTEAAIEAVSECVRLGIPAVTVLASGFSETGPEGSAREARLREIIAGTGTRLLGPSSLGLVNVHRRLVLTANAAFAEPELPAGGLFVASQSGSMIGALLSRGKARRIGFAGLVSVGGEVDIGVGDVCAMTLDQPEVTSYLLFLETIRNANAIRTFAFEAARRGKPVIAYKLGRSPEAAELAMSHTGALAGEDDLADAFFRECGIARVETLEGLLEAPELLRRMPIRPRGAPSPKVGLVTTTGGGAAMVVDQLGIRNVEVVAPSPETLTQINSLGVEVGHGRIVDLTLAGTRPEIMGGALNALLADPKFDLVVAVVGSSARFQPDLAVQPIVGCAGQHARLAAFLVPEAPDALAMLGDAGVPAFRTPEACADAIAAGLRRRPPVPAPVAASGGERRRVLDEHDAYGLLARVGVDHAPSYVVEIAQAGKTPLPFSYPVAVKALHADLQHKSDAGGVRLGISSDSELAAAAQEIVSSVEQFHPGLKIDRVLVQPMTRGVGEALVGFRRDPMFGPIVLVAAGGVLTEIYRDRAVRLAPVSVEEAREMVDEVKAFKALGGYRGKPRGDLEALARTIAAISQMSVMSNPAVVEFEANPLIVRLEGEGVVAVDALAEVTD